MAFYEFRLWEAGGKLTTTKEGNRRSHRRSYDSQSVWDATKRPKSDHPTNSIDFLKRGLKV